MSRRPKRPTAAATRSRMVSGDRGRRRGPRYRRRSCRESPGRRSRGRPSSGCTWPPWPLLPPAPRRKPAPVPCSPRRRSPPGPSVPDQPRSPARNMEEDAVARTGVSDEADCVADSSRESSSRCTRSRPEAPGSHRLRARWPGRASPSRRHDRQRTPSAACCGAPASTTEVRLAAGRELRVMSRSSAPGAAEPGVARATASAPERCRRGEGRARVRRG
mgnify:CR=1 FL=1